MALSGIACFWLFHFYLHYTGCLGRVSTARRNTDKIVSVFCRIIGADGGRFLSVFPLTILQCNGIIHLLKIELRLIKSC